LTQNTAVTADDFLSDVTDKSYLFTETGEHTATVLVEEDEDATENFPRSIVCQGKNSISVIYELGPEAPIVFFKTKDPDMVFLNDIKVGDSLSSVLKEGKIPGEMKKLDTSGDMQAWQWNFPELSWEDPEYIAFTVYAQGDSITEFVYHNHNPADQGSGNAYVDVTKLDYAR
jgi:hypothetical protein